MAKRAVEWHGDNKDASALTTGAATVFELASYAELEVESAKPTITRTVGRIVFNLNADDDIATMSCSFWAGIGVVDENLQGTGNFPNPFFRPDYPWMWTWHGRVWAAFEDTGSADGMQSGHRKEVAEVDIAAQRIVRVDQGLYLVVHQTVGPGDTQVGNISYGLRYLLKA